jgi:hypothetical protein
MSVCRTIPMHTMHVAAHSQQRSADPLMPPGRRNLQRLPALLPSESPLPQFLGRLAGRGLTLVFPLGAATRSARAHNDWTSSPSARRPCRIRCDTLCVRCDTLCVLGVRVVDNSGTLLMRFCPQHQTHAYLGQPERCRDSVTLPWHCSVTHRTRQRAEHRGSELRGFNHPTPPPLRLGLWVWVLEPSSFRANKARKGYRG